MAKFNKDTQNRIDAINQEQELQTNLSSVLTKNLDLRTRQGKIAKDVRDITAGQKDLSDKLNTILQTKQKILEGTYELDGKIVKLGEARATQLLNELESSESYLKSEQKRKQLTSELSEIGKDFTKDLAGALGISEELLVAFKKLSIAAIALLILKEVAAAILDSVGNVKDLSKELGVSYLNAAKLEGNIQLARAELIGLGYDASDVRKTMGEFIKQTGSFRISPDALADVTKMTELLGEGGSASAVSLQRTLSNAGIDAGELTDEITKMANSMKMDAGPAMEFLADNQLLLGGMTKEQALVRAEEALILKKMGADMKKLNSLAGEALNIEQSLRNEMKLRMLTGKEISFNAIRAAQAAGDDVALGKAQADLVAQLGDDLHTNAQLQRVISESTGMSVDQLLNYNNASKESAEIQKDVSDSSLLNLDNIKATVVQYGPLAVAIAGIVGAMILMKKAFGGKDGNPISNFVKSMGDKGALKGAAAMLVISAALFVTAKALQEFNTVDLASLGKAGLALLGLTATLAGLGLLMASPIGLAIGAGVVVILGMSVALLALGAGFALISNNIAGLENLVPLLTSLVLLSPGLLALSGSLVLLSGSLLALSVGLAAVGVFLPVLGAVSSLVGGGSAEGGGNGGGDNSGVINELKGLRRDIQAQPIMINVDGRVVSEISRVQRQQNSVRTTGYGR